MASCDSSESCEVGPKAGCVLDVTNRDDTRAIVDHAVQLRQIDPAFALFAHPHFDAKYVAYAKPRVDVRGKLAAERDHVIACAPVEAICDSRKRIGRVTHKSNLLRSRSEKVCKQLAGILLHRQPTAEVCRPVFVNVS